MPDPIVKRANEINARTRKAQQRIRWRIISAVDTDRIPTPTEVLPCLPDLTLTDKIGAHLRRLFAKGN